MAALGWLLNLGMAGSEGAAVVTSFGDLTTLFSGYIVTLRATGSANDVDTEIAADLPTVRTSTSSLDDLNTAYAEYLS